jgi:hypothetical protein
MFHMTNDSGLFLKADELERQGWQRAPLNRWRKGGTRPWPLYEGKMVQMYDHRAADVVVNAENLQARSAARNHLTDGKGQTGPMPGAAVLGECHAVTGAATVNYWALAFKDVTAPTNVRTMIAAMVPGAAFGQHAAHAVTSERSALAQYSALAALLLANFGSLAFDFVARQKVQGQHLNWFILEQLPVIAPERFDETLPTAFTKPPCAPPA